MGLDSTPVLAASVDAGGDVWDRAATLDHGSVALHEDGRGVPPPVRLEPLDRLDDELAGGAHAQPMHQRAACGWTRPWAETRKG